MALKSVAGVLSATRSALLVCDIQERFRPVISGMPAVIHTAKRLVMASRELNYPVLVTEQYPKALGKTVDEISGQMPEGTPVWEKTNFSMITPEVKAHLSALEGIDQVLLVGIEAHVCVLQTTLDLVESGYEVHLMVDGVSSTRFEDRSVAIKRMAQAGALMSTSEMALFQMMGNAKAPAFKAVSAIVKDPRPDSLPSIN